MKQIPLNDNVMTVSMAHVTLVGTAPMTQSHQHDAPKLKAETPDAYDIRTWRQKLNTEVVDWPDGTKRSTIVIPAHGVQQMIASAARYSKRQIPGHGKATWTAKFTSGIMLLEAPRLFIDPESVGSVTISADANGKRGSGTRVPRRFPVIPPGWEATFEVAILDPIITGDIFAEMVSLAGMFIGVGQFRPEKGGTNGRFRLTKLMWEDNRPLVSVAPLPGERKVA